MRTLTILFLSVFILSIQSCKKDEGYGKQSPMGEVGNGFDIGYIPGVDNASAVVTGLSDGVSTIEFTGTLTDQSYVSLANGLALLYPNAVQISGNVATLTMKMRITDKGFRQVFTGGSELTYCEYEADKGTSWSTNRNGKTLTSTITKKTGVDDYPYGFWNIKVSEAEINSEEFSSLGLQDLKLYFNHKFGFVGLAGDFSSYGNINFNIYSDAEN